MTGNLISQLGGRNTLEKALFNNLIWIKKSFAHNNNLGSSGWSNLLGKFSAPYPETTGYLIPTLINSSQYLNDSSYLLLAEKQVDFFSSIQNSDGSFYQSINNKAPIVFDTSQILLGLCAIYQYQINSKLLEQINLCLDWLLSLIDKKGHFTNYNFTKQSCPAYYSRVFWAMLLAQKLLGLKANPLILSGVNSILQQRQSNNSFLQWGFDNESYVLTHNIVYTLRGLYETALLSDNKELLSVVENCINSIISKILADNKLYGAYNHQWEPDRSMVCSVGNAQLAYLMLTIDRSKYSVAIKKVLQPLLLKQSNTVVNKGAVPSSLPIWGRYQRWRYTNWTQKFFCDALLSLLKE